MFMFRQKKLAHYGLSVLIFCVCWDWILRSIYDLFSYVTFIAIFIHKSPTKWWNADIFLFTHLWIYFEVHVYNSVS